MKFSWPDARYRPEGDITRQETCSKLRHCEMKQTVPEAECCAETALPRQCGPARKSAVGRYAAA